jgi:hypothetical protein
MLNQLPAALEPHLRNPQVKPFVIADDNPFAPTAGARFAVLEFSRFPAASPGRATSFSIALPHRVRVYAYDGAECALRHDFRDEEGLLRLNEVEVPLFTSPLPVDLRDGTTVMVPILVDGGLLEAVLSKLLPPRA